MIHDVIVIGGGASGMFAAGRAAEAGLRVLLIERNPRLGKKLGITGNGRCNLTNTDDTAEFIANFGANGKFLHGAIARFSSQDLREFFRQHGVPTRVEEEGRVFPASGTSEGVVKALDRYLRKHKATVMLDTRVERIAVDPAGGAVAGVVVIGGAGTIGARRIVLATGGLSYPATGSTGDGYRMAEQLGHTITPLRPSLVPLETEESLPKDLQGLALKNVAVTVLSDGRRIRTEAGDLIFTHFGISGPVVLKLSGLVVDRLDGGEKVSISIGLLPALDAAGINDTLIRELAASGKKSAGTVMKSLLPKALVPVLMESAGVSEGKRGGQVTAGERKKLVESLMSFRLTVKGARPIAEAIVTRGGIDVGEIDPRTMESKKVKGLFFCGEVIDIDGSTGGYNLQAAFSTAFVAATGA
jgi:predicted Rossmann fold flavoprotein